MNTLNEIGKDLEVREANEKETIEAEHPERIYDLEPIKDKNVRTYVTKLIAICGCGVFVFSMLWGAFTKDWEPLNKFSEFISFIIDSVMYYFV